MNSDLPKVAHEVGGLPMVNWVARACADAGCGRIVVVVGYKQDVVRGCLSRFAAPGVEVVFAEQVEQLGTGHAVMCARGALGVVTPDLDVFVLAGDGPLIRGHTLSRLLERHRSTGASGTLATSVIDDPAGYGRIVRHPDGSLDAIVEDKHCTPDQRHIREVNPSYYCFNAPAMLDALARVRRNESSGEYYITDVPSLMISAGLRVEVIDAVPPEDVLSINTPQQLAQVDAVLRRRLNQASPAAAGGAR